MGFVDDHGSAITVDKIRDWIANGQGFAASYSQSASSGNYAFSIFNPSNSGKSILIISNRIIYDYASSNTSGSIILNTSDPGYTAITPVNLKAGSSISSVASVSANTATTSWPSGTTLDGGVVANSEYLTNNTAILLPPGHGFAEAIYIGGSSKMYAYTAKWVEYT